MKNEAVPSEPNMGQAQRARNVFGDEAVDDTIAEFGMPEPGTKAYADARGRFAAEDDLDARATTPDTQSDVTNVIDITDHGQVRRAADALEDVEIPDIDLEQAREEFGHVVRFKDVRNAGQIPQDVKDARIEGDAYGEARQAFHDAPPTDEA
jgi:hypothetical protein